MKSALAFAGSFVLLFGLLGPAQAEQPGSWNVLFIAVDDLRPELGCYGVQGMTTPHIDSLAAASVRFDRAYCQFPLCNPSRTSMLTGRYPTTTGVMDNLRWFGADHPDFVTLPRHFKNHGYAAVRVGKIFHGGIDDADAWTEGGEPRTFTGPVRTNAPGQKADQSDRVVVLEGDGEKHNDHRTAARAIEALRKHRQGPFFLAVGFSKPHSPPTARQKDLDLYQAAAMPLPVDFQPRPTVPMGFPAAAIPMRNSDLFIGRDASPEAAREMIRAYRASVSFMDSQVGRVLAELDQLGLRERTIIVFFGDHGYHLGEKGKWSKHNSLFEVAARVPLLVSAPRAAGNSKPCPRTVQLLDVYPTLIELCKLPPAKGLEGHSLAPLLHDPQAAWSHAAYTVARNAKTFGRSVRTERYRYSEWDGGDSGAVLFDHETDPQETRNLAADPAHAPQREKLRQLLAAGPK